MLCVLCGVVIVLWCLVFWCFVFVDLSCGLFCVLFVVCGVVSVVCGLLFDVCRALFVVSLFLGFALCVAYGVVIRCVFFVVR